MTGRQSSAVDTALKLLAKGHTITGACAKAGITPSTLYRACKRLNLSIAAGRLKTSVTNY